MSGSTPESEYVTDTVGLVLRLERRRLKPAAKAIFEGAEAKQAVIHIPGMVFAEVLYLSEKGRIFADLQSIMALMQRHPNYREYPMGSAVLRAAAEIRDIPELHDRLIAATARCLNVPLITNDPVIEASCAVDTVW